MRTMMNHLTMRLVMTALFTMLASSMATATDFITDVKVIGGPTLKNDVNPLWYDLVDNQGWTGIDYDLNKGCGESSDYIYLLYKTTSSPGSSGIPITDIYIKHGDEDVNPTMTYFGRTYYLAPYDGGSHFKEKKGDLNSNAGGHSIHIYYTTETFSDNRAITSISFNETQSGAVGENGGSVGYDLNSGCGENTADIYMHLTTATAPVENCYFKDVMLIGAESKSDVNSLMDTYVKQGWKVIGYDLNKGCGEGTDYIYLLYKTEISSDGYNHDYITDFYLQNKGPENTTNTLTYNDRTYTLVAYDGSSHFMGQKGDLNSHAGGDAIHLYYTKDRFLSDGRIVNGIAIDGNSSGAVGKEGGSAGYNLNASTGGNDIYLHITTVSKHKNLSPQSCLDVCRQDGRGVLVQGWAYDPDEPDLSIPVRVVIKHADGSDYKTETLIANILRTDVNNAKGISGNHGFSATVPIKDSGTYTVTVSACDITGNADVQMGNATTLTLTGSKPKSCLDAVVAADDGVRVQGWAYDPDAPAESVPIRVEVKTSNGDLYKTMNSSANLQRDDVNTTFAISGNHGFSVLVPIADDGTYTVSVYAGDLTNDGEAQVGDAKPVTITNLMVINSETAELTVTDGKILTGTGGPNTRIIIAAGATVTLSGVTITSPASTRVFGLKEFDGCNDYPWSGITCLGNATIVLADGTTNLVQAGCFNYAAVHAGPPGTTLTIRGNGTLRAQNFGNGASIGCKGTNAYLDPDTWEIFLPEEPACGDIVIESGNIIAESGRLKFKDPLTETIFENVNAVGDAAAIGTGNCSTCGNITILGGSITAKSGDGAAIGGGGGSHCGNITIGTGRIYIDASKSGGSYVVGQGASYELFPSSCGTLTIAGVQSDYISGKRFVYPQRYSITYVNAVDGEHGVTNKNPKEYCCYDAITLAEPQRFGFQFDGWTWDGQATPTKSVTIPQNSSGDRVFTANWTMLTPFELTPDMGYIELVDGHILTGTGGKDVHVTISDRATVTLSGVTIEGLSSGNAITCLGKATIILADGTTNRLTGASQCAGIFISDDHTLTIKGNGTLYANGNGSPGIGGNSSASGGDIVIMGGNIIATGGSGAAGIGSSGSGSCGRISIKGGTITATGGIDGAGIGSGINGHCGDIVLDGGIVNVVGRGDAAGLGCGVKATCGDITIYSDITKVSISKENKMMDFIGKGYETSTSRCSVGNICIGYGLTEVSEEYTCKYLHASALTDNADNTAAVDAIANQQVNIAINGRTFYQDGTWNTLCLPFNATKTGPLAGAVIKELDTETEYNGHKTGLENGTLYLNFKDAESIVAGRPYIVKWQFPDSYLSNFPIIDPTDEYANALGFITDPAMVQSSSGTGGFANLLDGDLGTKYFLDNDNPRVEFSFAEPIIPKGYALWTAAGQTDNLNPEAWAIMAKNDPSDPWTTLTAVDNHHSDKLPGAGYKRTVFMIDNDKPYKYFCFEATRKEWLKVTYEKGDDDDDDDDQRILAPHRIYNVVFETISEFQLAELQFCTGQPRPEPFMNNPVFEDVTINANAPSAVTSEDGKVTFAGTYTPIEWTTENKSILFVGASNTLFWPKPEGNRNPHINAFRAYFNLNGNVNASKFVLNFEDCSTTSLSEELRVKSEEFAPAAGWFTLDGRKLNAKPTAKGIYIHNGKKVVIK